MLQIGKMNHLQVVKDVPFGIYLEAGEVGTILLPGRYVPQGCKVDDWLDVFVYVDSEDLLIATTLQPAVMVGESAYLKVVDVNATGAFMDWGLPKDLLVPFNEQQLPMQTGRSYVVYVYLDEVTNRIVASTKLSYYLREQSVYLKPRQPVDLLICGRSELGYKAVVDGTHLGLIFSNELFQPLRIGQRVAGYIKSIRDDGKLDLCLRLPGKESVGQLGEQILAQLRKHNGTLLLTDKSPPEAIYQAFSTSKASYKRALGHLNKLHKIKIEKDKITLLKS